MATSGAVGATAATAPRRRRRRDDLETRLLEDTGQGGPEQSAVLGYDDSHGSSTAMVVPAPGRAGDPQRAAEGGDPVLEPRKPVPASMSGAAAHRHR